MRILALETSGSLASIALIDGDGVRVEVAFRHRLDLSRTLLARVARLLADAGIAIAEVEGIGVSLGPGSFTGLRIGVATAKTLAYALDAPLAGVATLRALALGTRDAPRVAAVIAGAGERVYSATYRRTSAAFVEERAEADEPLADLAARIRDNTEPLVLVTPSAAVIDAAGAAESVLLWPSAAIVGVEARRRLLAGERDDPIALAPHYLRASTPEVRLRGEPWPAT